MTTQYRTHHGIWALAVTAFAIGIAEFIVVGTNLSKFKTVSIYCERFNANFGTAPLKKF